MDAALATPDRKWGRTYLRTGLAAMAFGMTVLLALLLVASKAHADPLPPAPSLPPVSDVPAVDLVQPPAVTPTPATSTTVTPDSTTVTTSVTDVVAQTLSSTGVAPQAPVSVDTALPSASTAIDTDTIAPVSGVMTSATSVDAVPAPAAVVHDVHLTTALTVPVDIARATAPAVVDPIPQASSQPTNPTFVATTSREPFDPVVGTATTSWTSQRPVATLPRVSASGRESPMPARAPADPSPTSTTSLPLPRPTQPERGAEVMLFVLATIVAWSDPRVRRVLVLGAVTPRDPFVSFIERPG